MSVTIHCIRHGQGFHNVGAGNYLLPDPKLTPLGEEQCFVLRDQYFSDQSHISLVAASPMSRTIQTAFCVFRSSLTGPNSPTTIVALPDTQETSDDPCDIGSDLDVLKTTCDENGWPVDLSLLKDGWNIKRLGGRYSPSAKAIARRARDARVLLRRRAKELIVGGDQDVHIVLVTHGSFLHFFTEDWESAIRFPSTGWVNCETRAYMFQYGVGNVSQEDEDADAHLIETVESRRGRGVADSMVSRVEQKELFAQAMQSWEEQGLQNPIKVDIAEEKLDLSNESEGLQELAPIRSIEVKA